MPKIIMKERPHGTGRIVEFFFEDGSPAPLPTAHVAGSCIPGAADECPHCIEFSKACREAGRALARHKEQQVIDAIFKEVK